MRQHRGRSLAAGAGGLRTAPGSARLPATRAAHPQAARCAAPLLRACRRRSPRRTATCCRCSSSSCASPTSTGEPSKGRAWICGQRSAVSGMCLGQAYLGPHLPRARRLCRCASAQHRSLNAQPVVPCLHAARAGRPCRSLPCSCASCPGSTAASLGWGLRRSACHTCCCRRVFCLGGGWPGVACFEPTWQREAAGTSCFSPACARSSSWHELAAASFFAPASAQPRPPAIHPPPLQVPSNLVLQRVGPKVWLPLITAAWGLVSMCCAAIRGPVSFFLLRVALGATEAGAPPRGRAAVWRGCAEFGGGGQTAAAASLGARRGRRARELCASGVATRPCDHRASPRMFSKVQH